MQIILTCTSFERQEVCEIKEDNIFFSLLVGQVCNYKHTSL